MKHRDVLSAVKTVRSMPPDLYHPVPGAGPIEHRCRRAEGSDIGFKAISAKGIGEFVDAHPSIKMLALSFLILVGAVLIGEGLEMHIPKGYIYFAMAFSFAVEMMNICMSKKRARHPVALHGPRSTEHGRR